LYGRGYQTPGFGFGPPVTPPVVKQLLITNAVVFVLQMLYPALFRFGAVTPVLVVQGGYLWQPFTYMWLHAGLGHLAMNLFVLWMFGSQLAMAWGPKRFMRFYLICGLGAGVIISIVPYLLVGIGADVGHALVLPTVGASGAIYGVLLAYSLTWPDRTIMLIFPPVAFRAIWLIPAMFLMTFLFGERNVSHVGHLGGVLVAWLYLRRQGDAGKLLTVEQLKYRWRRYRMRRKLRAIRYEEYEARRRRDDDQRLH
jgi:membrane associated rhomboid family serine protease